MDSFCVCTGVSFIMSFSGGTSGKEPSCQCKLDETHAGSIPGWGRRPGGGHGNPLQYSCLENPMDRGAWLVTIHRIAKVRHDWNNLARRHTLVYYIRVWCFSKWYVCYFFFLVCFLVHSQPLWATNAPLRSGAKIQRGVKINVFLLYLFLLACLIKPALPCEWSESTEVRR